MRLPGVEGAIIDERKLTDYLLAEGHPAGRTKAKFFHGLGFTKEAVKTLRDALLEHARRHEVCVVENTQFGSKYVVDGLLHGLDDRKAFVRAVWFIELAERRPRFVTAYPRREVR